MSIKSLKKLSLECIFKDWTIEDKLELLINSLDNNEKVEFHDLINNSTKDTIYTHWKHTIPKSRLNKFLNSMDLYYVWNCFQFQQQYDLEFDILNIGSKYYCCIFSVLDEPLLIKTQKDGDLYIDTFNKQTFCKYDTNLLKKINN